MIGTRKPTPTDIHTPVAKFLTTIYIPGGKKLETQTTNHVDVVMQDIDAKLRELLEHFTKAELIEVIGNIFEEAYQGDPTRAYAALERVQMVVHVREIYMGRRSFYDYDPEMRRKLRTIMRRIYPDYIEPE